MRICSPAGWIWTGMCKQKGFFGSRQGPHCSTTVCLRSWKRSFSIQKVSYPDFIQPWLLETQPQIFLLGSWSQNPPTSHPEHPRGASCSQFLFFPEAKPGNKALRAALWVGGFPFSFVALFPALEQDKKRNCWVIQHLRSWRGEFTTGEKFRTCSVPAMEEPGVWNGHRVERFRDRSSNEKAPMQWISGGQNWGVPGGVKRQTSQAGWT